MRNCIPDYYNKHDQFSGSIDEDWNRLLAQFFSLYDEHFTDEKHVYVISDIHCVINHRKFIISKHGVRFHEKDGPESVQTLRNNNKVKQNEQDSVAS